MFIFLFVFFFFKQKTAYEITVRDWSSDVCSSDLAFRNAAPSGCRHHLHGASSDRVACRRESELQEDESAQGRDRPAQGGGAAAQAGPRSDRCDQGDRGRGGNL